MKAHIGAMKIYAVAIFLAISMSLVVSAQGTTIKTLNAVGKGIAISVTDPSDFTLLKIGIARVSVELLGETQEVSAGILILDNDKYRLRNINIGNGSATADVYSNSTDVGDINIASVQKGDTIVWFGTLTVNGKTYNVYILEAGRQIKPFELGENVADFCRANRGHENCRERMAEFCQQNPTDARCRQIFLEFCKENPDDVRCRDAIREFCNERPTNSLCRRLGEHHGRFCERAADVAEKACERTADICERACRGPNEDECEENCNNAEEECKDAVEQAEARCRQTTTTSTTTSSTTTTVPPTTTTAPTTTSTTTTTVSTTTTTTTSTTTTSTTTSTSTTSTTASTTTTSSSTTTTT